MDPIHYINHLKNLSLDRLLSYQSDNLSDNQYDWSEVYYEQINNGFWIFLLETEEKVDTCYVYQSDKSMASFFSISYFEAKRSFIYQLGEEKSVNKKIAIFNAPGTQYKIYVNKKSPIRCYRLVFSNKYLKKMLNFSASDHRFFQPSQIILTGKGIISRNMDETELMAIQKLNHILKKKRSAFNYQLSLTASALDLTDIFFKISSTDQMHGKRALSDEEVMTRIISYLKRHIKNKFPGIDSLSAQFYISPTKLKAHFKRTYQVTPLVYFRRLQIIYAFEVLQRKKITIKELAMELNFKKSSTFSFWFKRFTGKLPHEI